MVGGVNALSVKGSVQLADAEALPANALLQLTLQDGVGNDPLQSLHKHTYHVCW